MMNRNRRATLAPKATITKQTRASQQMPLHLNSISPWVLACQKPSSKEHPLVREGRGRAGLQTAKDPGLPLWKGPRGVGGGGGACLSSRQGPRKHPCCAWNAVDVLETLCVHVCISSILRRCELISLLIRVQAFDVKLSTAVSVKKQRCHG